MKKKRKFLFFQLASVHPKEAMQIQWHRLLLYSPFLLALGAIPMLKYMGQMEFENGRKSTKAWAIIYHLLLMGVPFALEKCIQVAPLAQYQRQLERAKAKANADNRVARRAREELLRLMVLNNNGNGSYGHGYVNRKLLMEFFKM